LERSGDHFGELNRLLLVSMAAPGEQSPGAFSLRARSLLLG
jgi:hypothetical protein